MVGLVGWSPGGCLVACDENKNKEDEDDDDVVGGHVGESVGCVRAQELYPGRHGRGRVYTTVPLTSSALSWRQTSWVGCEGQDAGRAGMSDGGNPLRFSDDCRRRCHGNVESGVAQRETKASLNVDSRHPECWLLRQVGSDGYTHTPGPGCIRVSEA